MLDEQVVMMGETGMHVAPKDAPLSRVLGDEAVAAQGEGNLTLAEEKWGQLVAAEPNNAWANYNLMVCLILQERRFEALEVDRRLLDIQPVSPEALQNVGWLLTNLELDQPYHAEVTKVLDGYEAVLRKDGEHAGVQRGLNNLVVKFLDRFVDRYRPVLISTVGGAGTYFTIHFLHYLDRRLGPYSKDYDPLQSGLFEALTALPRLRLFKVTSHALCPGFEQTYRGPHREAWDRLVAESEPERLWAQVAPLLDPSLTPKTRIVHIHRDPFEWAITTYRAAVRKGTLPDTPEALREDIIGQRLKRFVVQYFSYRTMAELFPEQIMLIPFETLVADPFRTFGQILSFFDVPEVSPDLIRSSIKSSSPQALMKLEDRTGRTTGPTGVSTHFDRDRTGRERIVLTEQDQDLITRMFGELGISLSEFGAKG